MRILISASYSESILNFRGDLIVEMINRGHEVFVCAPNFSIENKKSIEKIGVKVFEINLNRNNFDLISDMRYVYQIAYLISKLKPDVFFPYTIKPVVYGLICAYLLRIKIRIPLITGLGYIFEDENEPSLLKHLTRYLYKKVMMFATKIIFQNQDDLRFFQSQLIVKPTTPFVVVHGSGINLAKYCLQAIPKKISFLMIARLLRSKGIYEYVAAAQKIKEKYPDVIFKLIGWIDFGVDSISPNELSAWIESGVINFIGKVDDVRGAISESSVYVLPSYREGTPRTVLEAMAIGRPIITTDSPGCRETVINQFNGCLVSIKSIEELVVAMKFFINNPEMINIFGARSRQLAESKYDVHKVNDEMLSAMGL